MIMILMQFLNFLLEFHNVNYSSVIHISLMFWISITIIATSVVYM